MRSDEQKRKHAKYMREYTRKHKEDINAKRRKRYANLSEEERERKCELNRIRNKHYYENNRDNVNARAKARNWNYNPEKAKTKRQEYYSKYPARNILRTVQKRAEDRNLPFDLTEEWYNEQFKKGCAVTQIRFAQPRSGSPWSPHIDKITPDEGYTVKNCRLVCAMYNQAKGKWTDNDVEDMAFCIVNIKTSDA